MLQNNSSRLNPPSSDKAPSKSAMLIATLGIVYGDIGTSPLYALKNCFTYYDLPVDQINIFGIISLIFWSLTIVVSFKYVRLILKADNHGEGGILALLTRCSHFGSNHTRKFILFIGLIGAALFYGDGVITPAISVVGALEGLDVISKNYAHLIPFMAAGILATLFIFQKHGSQVIGSWFGQVMLVWFIVLAVLGIYQIMQNPTIFYALNPYYGLKFIHANGMLAILTFGAIVSSPSSSAWADRTHAVRAGLIGLAQVSPRWCLGARSSPRLKPACLFRLRSDRGNIVARAHEGLRFDDSLDARVAGRASSCRAPVDRS